MPRARDKQKIPAHALASLSDDRLLSLRFKDLDLAIDNTPLEARVARLHSEFDAKGLRFRPYVWLSTDWFTPEGLTGFAIPFYLAHPRLTRLERKMMLRAEGDTREECMKILRHETGHTIQHAYRLHRRKRWRELFGRSSEPYPDTYQPKPYSKRFVLHIDYWYAQSHPDEDFAETFAVWLTPRFKWRERYKGWGALEKLEYVDELMAEIADEPPPVRTRERYEPLSRVGTTLREHYDQRRAYYEEDHPGFYDRDLRKLFSDRPEHRKNPSAASFLRRHRVRLRETVAYWTGQPTYTIDVVIRDMIARCHKLELRVASPEADLGKDAAILVTVQTMNFLHSGRHRIAM